MMKNNINEIKLWDEFRGGSHEAFSTLYQHFINPLYSYSVGITQDKDLIKDCLHDLFVELWKNHSNLGPTTSVKFYLMASIKRKLIRHLDGNLRSNHHHMTYTRDFTEDSSSQESVLIQDEIQTEMNLKVNKSLHLLSKRQREAIQLKFYKNLDTDQISEQMNINAQSVYNLIFGALRVMRVGLTENRLV
jgi:RNA polymerase sigma factor (sigma-70 family)